MTPVESAFNELTDAAVAFAQAVGEESATTRLCDAADAYARARWSARTGAKGRADGKPTTSTMVLPFGREKGRTIAQAQSENLRWMAGALRESLDDAAKARWQSSNRALLDAIEAELRNRGESDDVDGDEDDDGYGEPPF